MIQNEIITKTAYILNNLEFDATEELLQDLNRIIEFSKPKSEVEQFIESVNNQLSPEHCFSSDFLRDIFDLPLDEGIIVFLTYLKFKTVNSKV